MTTSPRLGFTDLESGETNPGQAVAEISRYLEQGASGFIFEDRDLNDPTALTPADGDCYLINGTGAGDWLGHDDEIAFYMNTGWLFIPVQEGFRAWVKDEALWIGREAASWVTLATGTSAVPDETTAAEYRTGTTTGEYISPDVAWDAADYVALTDATTVAVDMSTGINFTLTIGGNRTLGAPTNMKAGQTGCIVITQDGTGSRTLAYNAAWLFAGGTDPVLSTAAGAKDVLFYQVLPGATTVIGNLVKAVA